MITAARGAVPSEQPTALFGDVVDRTTQHLDPRPTSPDRGLHPPAGAMAVGLAARGRRKEVVGALSLALIFAGVIVVAAVMRMRRAEASVDASALIYPGAQTVVDMANPDGSRTLQLRTKDPLGSVESWYQSNLKLEKTIRLTAASVVLKKDNVLITLVAEDSITNILIKKAP